MEILTELKAKGWHLTVQGLKTIQTNNENKNDVRDIINAALNLDFREIAEGALRSLRQTDCIKGPIVLQIQSIRNLAAPKANEESTVAPRLLCLELSDGQTSIRALELERIPTISTNLPPGTKVCFPSERIQLLGGGYIILRPAEIQILGGNVPVLVEKWELAKSMQMYAKNGRRTSGSAGPPPWVAFGKNLNEALHNSGLPKGQNFKSLQLATEKDKETKENEEFKAMRNEAIAEAAKAGGKKIFGGGGQHIIDHNVKKILEKGYSEDEAKNALRVTNNNLERALYNLKRSKEARQSSSQSSAPKTVTSRYEGSAGAISSRGLGKRGSNAKDEPIPTKPAGNVSLFDFLTDKLPTNSASETGKGSNQNNSTKINDKTGDQSVGIQEQKYTQQQQPRGNQQQPPYRNGRAGSGPDSIIQHQQNNSSNYERRESNSNRNSFRGGRTGGSFRNNNRGGNSGRVSNSRSDTKTDSNANGDDWRNNVNSRNTGERPGRGRNQDGNFRSNQRDQGQYGNSNSNINSGNNSKSTNENAYTNGKPSTNENTSRNENDRYNKPDSSRYRNQRDQQPKRPGHQQNYNSMQQQQQQQQQQSSQPQQHQKQPQQSNQYSGQSQTQNVSGSQNRYYNQKSSSANSNPSSNPSSAGMQNNFNNTITTQAVTSRASGGFAYDPSKIIGFQTKEANDYAMNLLKSQGKAMASPIMAAASLQQAASNQQPQYQPPPNVAQQSQYPPHSHPQHFATPPPPQAAMAPAAYVLSPPARPPPQQFGMIPSGAAWPWKIGDLCMAKYWDDGQYYEAEITGISDRTCVVFFVGYGNHEEVLKTDCLPITDVNHQPINTFTQSAALSAGAAMAPQAHFQPAPAAYMQRNNSQRYRSERQVYVPPPKRDN